MVKKFVDIPVYECTQGSYLCKQFGIVLEANTNNLPTCILGFFGRFICEFFWMVWETNSLESYMKICAKQLY